ncbi:AGE family epimerase/isomerase [Phenylobacterium sp.]|uniref:AGE family epimerase/isomerase n=1 Tax=Phenylobacterium sp. TaxID=1871053 RepID=UPI0035ADD094
MGATSLQAAWIEARDWLFDEALPLWASAGVDPAGGFHDQIGDDRRPVETAKRLRVQGRQMFVFAEAGRLGWGGPWRELVRHGLAFLTAHAPAPGRLYPSFFHDDGRTEGEELYGQAFVLLGLAHARRALDEAAAEPMALDLLASLRARLGRTDGGFNEVEPSEAPFQANPHMHLYEAALAWRAGSPAPAWAGLAADMRRLALDVFIEPKSGRLLEFFGADGAPAPGAPGREAWPGHLFEWASLLLLDGRGDEALAERLARLAAETGVDRARQVAIASQEAADGAPIDRGARLWAQTERLRACLLLRGRDGGFWTDEALEAFAGLRRYLAVPGGGLFRDHMDADGALDGGPAKATSLYHIVGAYAELAAAAEAVG